MKVSAAKTILVFLFIFKTSPAPANLADGRIGRCVKLLSQRIQETVEYWRGLPTRHSLWSRYFADLLLDSPAETRVVFNAKSLRNHLPALLSRGFINRLLMNAHLSLGELDFIPLFPDAPNTESPRWLDNLRQRTIELVLDANLPMWRSDADWYFECSRRILLYSPQSPVPIHFNSGEIVLMNDSFAIGKITLGEHAQVELFD